MMFKQVEEDNKLETTLWTLELLVEHDKVLKWVNTKAGSDRNRAALLASLQGQGYNQALAQQQQQLG